VESSKKSRFLTLILFFAFVVIVVLLPLEENQTVIVTEASPAPNLTITPEPILPTITPVPALREQPTMTSEPIIPTITPLSKLGEQTRSGGTGASMPSPLPTQTSTVTPGQAHIVEIAHELPTLLGSYELTRFGVSGELGSATSAFDAGLPFGSLLNWHVEVKPPERDILFWQMVRISEEGIRRTTWEEIEQAIQANPGSFWLVGNEPDVKWQDNVTPKRYAEIYHEVYTFVKSRDPGAKLVIGGVTQPTPLRRAYLDLILDSYQDVYDQAMPIDVWNVHAFTLREERDSWGVDIPPGMDEDSGMLYEIEDSDDLEILQQNLVEFRAWMADRGYGDKPLVVSEYGILMPEDYGFPPETVERYLTGSFELFQTLANETGYLPDEGRLVQWWFWYSVYDGGDYETGNLYDPSSGQLTPLGQAWAKYVTNLLVNE
jgi:hypothetical protein